MVNSNIPLLPDKIVEGTYFDRKGRKVIVQRHSTVSDLYDGDNGYIYGPRGDDRQYHKFLEVDTDDDLVAYQSQFDTPKQ